jgi:hypothetical protein
LVDALPGKSGDLTSAEAAAYLRMDKGPLDKLCSGAIETEARIPFRREGRRRIFVRQELDRWLDEGEARLAP